MDLEARKKLERKRPVFAFVTLWTNEKIFLSRAQWQKIRKYSCRLNYYTIKCSVKSEDF